jgi:glycosyltransferase involved in cell wall biosynthesis
MSLRVLHAPAEIAGQTTVLARALREAGIEAHSLAYNPGFPQYRPDEMRPYDAWPVVPRYAGYLKSLIRHAGRYDVYHFHFGRSLIPPHNPDLPLYRALGRKVVFHYHGCDVRNRAHMLATHTHAACTECDPFCDPKRQRAILDSARRLVDAELISTPDLQESAPNALHFPVAAHLPDYPFAPPRGAPRLVLHAPTNRLIKGTRYVEAAFEALRPRFPEVRFEVVERLPWDELRSRMAQADVVVDQLFMGWYGMVAVEAMAMGKAVLCFIRDDFEPLARGCPIVRCTKDDLALRLAESLAPATDRAALGEAGRAYVEREHAASVLARRLIAIYRGLGVDPVA